jgi:hypothetical protein
MAGSCKYRQTLLIEVIIAGVFFMLIIKFTLNLFTFLTINNLTNHLISALISQLQRQLVLNEILYNSYNIF